MLSDHGFELKKRTVICPACKNAFASNVLTHQPSITEDTVVEADLHRVIKDCTIRASLIILCISCNYCWWQWTFLPGNIDPIFLPKPDNEDPAKKFAYAVKTGRRYNAKSIEKALMALNGYWCARESNSPVERWLDLAIMELKAALADDSWEGNSHYYRYVLGEIQRLAGRFEAAQACFNAVDVEKSKIPYELIYRQNSLAAAGNSQPVVLLPHLVKAMFPVFQESEQSEDFVHQDNDLERVAV
jgi:tetratricopeptide (TPR) repeat protein